MSFKSESASYQSVVNKVLSDVYRNTTSSHLEAEKPTMSKSTILSTKSSQNVVTKPEFSVIQTIPPEGCKCGPDFYNRVLGHTADETILSGLQTVFDLCSKLRTCENEPIQEIPERDIPPPVPPVKTAPSQTEPSMASAGFQVNPSMQTTAVQTASFPEMVSEILQTIGFDPETASKIIQTSILEVPKEPSVTSGYMQTSTLSVISAFIQTAYDLMSNFAQTGSELLPTIVEEVVPTRTVMTQCEAIETKSEFTMPIPISAETVETQCEVVETKDDFTIPIPLSTETVETQCEVVETKNNFTSTIPLATETVETQCEVVETKNNFTSTIPFSTVNVETQFELDESQIILPISTETVETQYDPILYISRGTTAGPLQETPPSKVKVVNKFTNTDEHKCISPPTPPCKCCSCSSADSRKGGSKPCICHPKKGTCRCPTTKKKSNFTITGDQPPALETRYAITKISKFKEFTTFEVMRSTRNKPKQIPSHIEGVFVLKTKICGKEKPQSGEVSAKSSKSNKTRHTTEEIFSKTSKSKQNESRPPEQVSSKSSKASKNFESVSASRISSDTSHSKSETRKKIKLSDHSI